MGDRGHHRDVHPWGPPEVAIEAGLRRKIDQHVHGTIPEQRAVFDGYLLDIALPGLSGVELCRWLQDTGLEAGADDDLVKPFEIAELKARFRAAARKSQGNPREPLAAGDLVYDPNTRVATRAMIANAV